jgi:hypothetical protein
MKQSSRRPLEGGPDEPWAVRRARAHWQAMRGARALPSRADLDPADIRDLLPVTQLLDVIEGGADFRYRLIGTQVDALNGGFYTGRRLSETPCGAPPRALWELCRRAVAERRPVIDTIRLRGADAAPIDVRTALFPLSRTGGAADMLWGVVLRSYLMDASTARRRVAALVGRR